MESHDDLEGAVSSQALFLFSVHLLQNFVLVCHVSTWQTNTIVLYCGALLCFVCDVLCEVHQIPTDICFIEMNFDAIDSHSDTVTDV